MTTDLQAVPPAIYQLADHLDAALAAGEDLVAALEAWPKGPVATRGMGADAIAALRFAQRTTIEAVRCAEVRLIARLVTARERAGDVARHASLFKPLARLFTSATAVLVDAVSDCGDATHVDFATGDAITAYLRSRGIVDGEAPGIADDEPISVGDEFLVAGLAPLGALLDSVAMFLNSLDLHYDLYPALERDGDKPPAEAA